jgi:molecular chaperone Hsp33
MKIMNKDKLHRFLFDQANIRGEIVKLTDTWKTILSHHIYSQVIRELLGQVVAASVLLSATLKFEGSLTVQASGDGLLNLMVVECRNDFAVRAIAKYHEPLPLSGTDESGLKQLLGNGTLVITIEQAVTNERYQGIVALEGSSIAEFLEGYLQRSEQLETRIFLAADKYAAGGLLLQQLPGQRNEDDDSWDRITHLGSTIKDDELLTLTAREILHRLYHEEDIRLFDAEGIYFACSCSRNKVSNMLRSISQQEAADVLREQGNISVDCEFCGQTYEFDEIDIAEIYSDNLNLTASSTKH